MGLTLLRSGGIGEGSHKDQDATPWSEAALCPTPPPPPPPPALRAAADPQLFFGLLLRLCFRVRHE